MTVFMIKTDFLEREYPYKIYLKVKNQYRNRRENLCVGPQSYIEEIFRVQIRNQKAQNPQR